MMREYQQGDFDGFEPNAFSDMPNAVAVIAGEEWHKFSLIDGAKVMGVACVRHIGRWQWLGFFLISRHFTARHGVELRRFMRKGLGHYQPKALFTVSRRSELIERWHEFIGMKKHSPITVGDAQCDLWELGG